VKEALACNVPVVSVDVGDVRERISGAGTSSIADATPERIADALTHALDSNRIDTREGVAELSLEAIALRISEIYAQLTGTAVDSARAPA
jgi:glycosyltransferase involved in cell wall biosynthesis